MIRVGKATAGLILLASGAGLLADWSMDTNYLGYAELAWPLILVALGMEHVWVHFKYRKQDRPIRLDIGGVIVSTLIAAAIVAYSRYGWPPSRWFEDLSREFGSLGNL
ncbi:hypothetical protein [Paenibacillus ginsengarvi]|uniref:DUF5668 domain-containing protein n=1 Tax=Paenibacillus ginsengarvi TaxID=400777 RepID=A0A3B0BHS2_9BACL|nr:hypothetical protein [Paenibacillus ginsengarvi]RKN71834.1 hypothetical protein D7M11_28800 [Paenibacillus ginsengarvi]